MAVIYTIQLAKWRLAKKLGIRITDTTVKSGHVELAPSWDMVVGSKNGTMTNPEYIKRYDEVITKSQERYPEFWAALADNEIICLACYCRAGFFCHRHLLAKRLKAYCDAHGIECAILDELTE